MDAEPESGYRGRVRDKGTGSTKKQEEMRDADFSKWPDHSQEGCVDVEQYRLDVNGVDEPQQFLFRYKGCQLIAASNMAVFAGKEKQGKSAEGICLIVAALRPNGFLGIVPERPDLKILWIDTEQSRDTLRERARAALRMADSAFDEDRLIILSLKPASPSERLSVCLAAIRQYRPDFALIDQAADLVEDFNSNVECAVVVGELMKATEETGCAVSAVVHENKKDGNARGHLGSLLMQKCAECWTVSKTGDTATAKQTLCRFKEAQNISFKFGDDFSILPSTDGGVSEDEAKRERLRKTFAPLFDGVAEYKYSELCKAYQELEAVASVTAKKNISEAVKFSVLFKNRAGRGKSTYTFNFPKINENDDEDL